MTCQPGWAIGALLRMADKLKSHQGEQALLRAAKGKPAFENE